MHLPSSIAGRSNLELKTRPKQLLGSLLLDIVLPALTQEDNIGPQMFVRAKHSSLLHQSVFEHEKCWKNHKELKEICFSQTQQLTQLLGRFI